MAASGRRTTALILASRPAPAREHTSSPDPAVIGGDGGGDALWNGAPIAIGAVGLAMVCAVAAFMATADHLVQAAADALHGEAYASEPAAASLAPLPTLVARGFDLSGDDAAAGLRPTSDPAARLETGSVATSPKARGAAAAIRPGQTLVLFRAIDRPARSAKAPLPGDAAALAAVEIDAADRARAQAVGARLAATGLSLSVGLEIRAYAARSPREDVAAARRAFARALVARRLLIDAGVAPEAIRIAVRVRGADRVAGAPAASAPDLPMRAETGQRAGQVVVAAVTRPAP